ncbi:MAG: signal recognition particle-docking protein FtsY [Myxococcales bacterium]
MGSELIIALVVVAVVVAVLIFARSKTPKLPPAQPPEALPPTAAPRATPAAPAKPAAAPAAKPAAPGKPAAKEPEISVDEPVRGTMELTRDELVTPPPPPPRFREPEPKRPSAEDLASLKKGLASTRGGFIARLSRLFGGKPEIDPQLIEQIEEVLITADIGTKTTQRILDRLRDRLSRKELTDEERVWASLRDEARSILGSSTGRLAFKGRPAVLLVIGVNGVGKTTTIGKLASRLSAQGAKIMLVAADTFRAAAVLQLEVWGKRVGCPVVKGKENADPSSVVFDALKRAESEGIDLVIVDTAGRLHTKAPLMEELKKLGRTVEKALGRPADEILLVLDSTNGQNALQQAAMFREALPITGIVLTKLDGTAKGGVVLGIVDEQQLPIRFIGIGERVEDLREFDPQSFVDALFERPDSETSAA